MAFVSYPLCVHVRLQCFGRLGCILPDASLKLLGSMLPNPAVTISLFFYIEINISEHFQTKQTTKNSIALQCSLGAFAPNPPPPPPLYIRSELEDTVFLFSYKIGKF